MFAVFMAEPSDYRSEKGRELTTNYHNKYKLIISIHFGRFSSRLTVRSTLAVVGDDVGGYFTLLLSLSETSQKSKLIFVRLGGGICAPSVSLGVVPSIARIT